MRPAKGMPGHCDGNWNSLVHKVLGEIEAHDTWCWQHGSPLLGLQGALFTACAMVAPHSRPASGRVHGMTTVAWASPLGG
jgi:hypothetical protein